MSYTIDADQTDSAVRALLKDELASNAAPNTRIHTNDQMFSFIAATRGSDVVARSEYFTSGLQLLKILEQLVLWKFGSFESVEDLLDFASGYGRLTRFLVHKMPPSRVWVSDIQADAVAFQEAEFDVHGFVSTADPADLNCARSFDCIFVASLFSHLPPKAFVPWLTKLYSLLKPGGLLAFTVHGESGLAAGETMPNSGIWFSEGSEIASLDTQDYGRAVVTEAYVRDAIVAATGRPIYRRIPFGLLYHQDIYIIVNEQSPDFTSLGFAHLPHGTVDFALWAKQSEHGKSRNLWLRGWAVDMGESGSPVEVQIFVDGQLQQKCIPGIRRFDVSEHLRNDRFINAGWECSCQISDDDAGQLLTIKAIAGRAGESLLYLGPVASLLPIGQAELCLWIEAGELYVKGWAVDPSRVGSPIEVQIFVSGQLLQTVTPSLYRPELYQHFKDKGFLQAGWECSCQVLSNDPLQPVVVKSVSNSDAVWQLYEGTIASLEARGDAAFGQQREALLRLQADLHRRLEYIRHLEAEIARKNAALEKVQANAIWWPWRRRSRPSSK